MAITLNPSRQEPSLAYVEFSLADLSAGVALDAIRLPVGAVVISGALVVTTVFNGTSPTIAVGDATTGNRYLAATAVTGLGRTALVPTGFVHTATQPAVKVTLAVTGSPTTGAARLEVMYFEPGVSESTYE